MTNIIYKDESYKLMGILFDIHNNLGKGFSEIVYKDAIEYEFEKSKIFFEREKEYQIKYKEVILCRFCSIQFNYFRIEML